MSPIYQQGSSSCPRLNSLAVRFNTLAPRLGAGQEQQLKGTLKSMVVPSSLIRRGEGRPLSPGRLEGPKWLSRGPRSQPLSSSTAL